MFRKSAERSIRYLDMVGVTGSISVAPTTHSGYSRIRGDLRDVPAFCGHSDYPFGLFSLLRDRGAELGGQSLLRKIPFLGALRLERHKRGRREQLTTVLVH